MNNYLEYFNRLLEHRERVEDSMDLMMILSEDPDYYSVEELEDIMDEVKYLLGDK